MPFLPFSEDERHSLSDKSDDWMNFPRVVSPSTLPGVANYPSSIRCSSCLGKKRNLGSSPGSSQKSHVFIRGLSCLICKIRAFEANRASQSPRALLGSSWPSALASANAELSSDLR